MKSHREFLRGLVLALATACALAASGCGLDPPATPPPFHCEDYDMADQLFFATCALPVDDDAGGAMDDAGDVDAGDVDASDVDAGDVDAGDDGGHGHTGHDGGP